MSSQQQITNKVLTISVVQVRNIPDRVLGSVKAFIKVIVGKFEMGSGENHEVDPYYTDKFLFNLDVEHDKIVVVRVLDAVGFHKETVCEVQIPVSDIEQGQFKTPKWCEMTSVGLGVVRAKLKMGREKKPEAQIVASISTVSQVSASEAVPRLLNHVTFREPKMTCVYVKVTSLRNVIKRAILNRSLTPFLAIRMGDVTQQSSYGTGTNPTFDTEMVFCVPETTVTPGLHLIAKDYVKYGVDETLTEVTIPWSDIERGVLKEGKDVPMKAVAHGAVREALKFEDAQPCVANVVARILTTLNSSKEADKPIGSVKLEIHSLSELRHYSAAAAKFNPYCVARCNNQWDVLPTVLSNDNPSWTGSVMEFSVDDLSAMLTFCFFHSREIRTKKDKMLGRVMIRLSTLMQRPINKERYPLWVLHQPTNKLRRMGTVTFSATLSLLETPWAKLLKQVTTPVRFELKGLTSAECDLIEVARHAAVGKYLMSGTLPPEVFPCFDIRFSEFSGTAMKEIVGRLKRLKKGDIVKAHKELLAWTNPLASGGVTLGWLVFVWTPSTVFALLLLVIMVAAIRGLLGTHAPTPLDLDLCQGIPRVDTKQFSKDQEGEVMEATDIDCSEDKTAADDTPELSVAKSLELKIEGVRHVGLIVQNILEGIANTGERIDALLSGKDFLGSILFIITLAVMLLLVWFVPGTYLLQSMGVFYLRPPSMRTWVDFGDRALVLFQRMPTRTDARPPTAWN